MLDNTTVMNNLGQNSVLMDGDFEFTDSSLPGQASLVRNSYLWRVDVYETLLRTTSWTNPYEQILATNIVIEGLTALTPKESERDSYNSVLGSAYFYRAFAFHELAVLFTAPYQENVSEAMLGLPLKLTSDVTDIVQRSSLKGTYEQIVSDLQTAIDLLPIQQAAVSRPTKVAAYAQLARVYLNMERYDMALTNAKEALNLKSELLDYNQLSAASPRSFPHPFNDVNPEILYYARDNFTSNNSAAFLVKKEKYDTYATNDKRKTLFFTAARRFIGSYTGLNQALCGLTTNEVYLIAAESAARTNRPAEALDWLNTLAVKRYNSTFIPYASTDSEQILLWVLEERKKELITRRRWEDLRRLNQDSRFAVTLTRTFQGDTYTLPPNSSRYVLAIPQEEIDGSGIEQNERRLD